MILTLNFHEFLHTMYKYVLNSVVKITLIFAQYFEYYTIILRGGVFVDTLYNGWLRFNTTFNKILVISCIRIIICHTN